VTASERRSLEMLYRGMDRAQLDAAYNNSVAVKNYDAIKASAVRRGARRYSVFNG
jgi:hypothetical protein